MSLQKVAYGFIPTSITGCALWLDGADPAGTGVVPANGATISTWSDKSGNGKNAAATGTPTYLSGGGINFNGSSYFLNQTFSQNLSQRSIFIVMQETVRNDYFGVLSLIPNPTSGNDYSTTTGLSIETTNGLRFYANTGGYFADMGNNSLLVKAVYNDNMNGTTGSGFLNGNSATTVTASYTAGTCSGYSVGARWLGSIYTSYALNGVIYEILFFNSPLGTSDRRQVEGYLAQKWGLTSSLPSSHPGLTTTLYRSDYTKQNMMKAVPYYAAFSPRQISGCALWLDGADPAGTGVVPSAGTLATWVDKSTAGNNATGGVSPTYSSTTKAVSFNGSSTYLQTSLSAVPSNETFFAVFTSTIPISNANRFNCIIGASGNNGRDINVLTSSAGNSSAYDLRYDSWAVGSISLTGYGGITFNTLTLATTQFTGGQGAGSTYGSNFGSFQSLSFSSSSTTRIGAGNGGDYFTGTINEIIIYNTVLGLSDRQKIESYLAQKWGLTASLPGGHSHSTQPAGAVTTTALANLRLVVQPRRYVSFRWTITAGNTESLIQFSEFQVGFNGTQLVFASPTTATTGSSISWNTGAGEGPAQAVDNNLNTKGLGIGTSGLVLIVTVATPIAANMYRWATANDVTPGRNPTQWTVDGSADGTTFVRLHTQNTTYSTPSSTFTYTSWINFTYS